MKGELRPLTGARGIAAWWVVAYHTRLSIAGLPAPVLAVLAKGYLAVDFFFLLSGFVIWLAWHERLARPAPGMATRFWVKRIARVWPLHASMLAVAAALAALLAVTGRAVPTLFPPVELPLHLLLVQNWELTDGLTWNVPAWSISAEAAAYLLFPLGMAAADWRRWHTGPLLVMLAATLAALHLLATRAGAVTLGADIAHLGLPRCLFEFAAGTMLCALWLRWRTRPVLPGLVAAGLAALLLAGWSAGLAETLTVPGAFAALLLALALGSGWRAHPLGWAPLHALGEISYATYLSHYLLFMLFKLAMVSDAGAVPPMLIALFAFVLLTASVALYHLVEKPAQAWVERLAGGWRGGRAAPLA